jgi:hypothetical protein
MRHKRRIVLGLTILVLFSVLRIAYLSPGNPTSRRQDIQKGYYDYQGLIHFHTRYSGDATGTFEEIANVANRQHVDFMISTDHETLQPLVDHKEGWYKNTLFLVGTEIRVKDGYILSLNNPDDRPLFQEDKEQQLLDWIGRGGILLIAHPSHPIWRWKSAHEEGFTGQEVLDLADQWYTADLTALLTGMAYYPFNSSAALMQIYHYPAETLKEWDLRSSKKSFVGIFAPDFHQSIKITSGFRIPFPGADKILPLGHDHVLLHSPWTGDLNRDKVSLYDAIMHGHLYFSMDILGDATGFFFSARQVDQVAWMGDQLKAGIKTFFSIQIPESAPVKKTRIRVLQDGNPIFVTEENGFHFQSATAGAYRVEVETVMPTFWGAQKKVTWIYSNPIYLR